MMIALRRTAPPIAMPTIAIMPRAPAVSRYTIMLLWRGVNCSSNVYAKAHQLNSNSIITLLWDLPTEALEGNSVVEKRCM